VPRTGRIFLRGRSKPRGAEDRSASLREDLPGVEVEGRWFCGPPHSPAPGGSRRGIRCRKGFPEASGSIYRNTRIQLCIAHTVRNSLRFVFWKERKAVAKDLRAIYTAATLEAAEEAMATFEERWDDPFPSITRSWRAHWANVTPFFDYPPELRKVNYMPAYASASSCSKFLL